MRWNSIRTKLICFLLIATIVPTIATMVITYVYNSHSLRERALEENQRLIYQGKQNLLNMLDNLNRSSLSVYTDFEFFRMLERGYNDTQMEAQTYTMLQNIESSMRDIWQVYLYRSEVKRSTLMVQSVPRRQYDVEPYVSALRYTEQGIRMQPTHMSHTYGFSTSPYFFPSIKVFTIHRPIYKTPSTERLGMLSIDVKLDAISEISEQLYVRDKEQLYIVDEDGYIVYSDNRERLGKKVQEPWMTPELLKAGKSGHFEYDQALYVHESIDSPIAQWTVIKRIPNTYLLLDAKRAVSFNMMLLAISLLIIVAATLWITIRITEPIRRLMRYMNQIQAGNLNVDIQVGSEDEIGVMSKRFRSMMDTINNLILQEYKLELANKTNQLKALQAQINPHFMNNALQSIGTLALQHQAPHIYSLIAALAKMMRYSMFNEESTATLRAEVEHVQAYLKLQGQRFEHTFDVQMDIDPTTLHLIVPKMTLQPIVENYFKHGLDRTVQGGMLRITSRWANEHTVELIVEDNGFGIPPDKLEQLNHRLQESSVQSGSGYHGTAHAVQMCTSLPEPSLSALQDESKRLNMDGAGTADEALSRIGLMNVLTRLHIFSSQHASMQLEAVDPHGARVKIQMKVGQELNEGTNRG
ncbi:sensor histidine kinase [Paenibacillus taiwanensis]|uniref:sensor histidine kinase n=1 Tax=Paenibacillus taiwanensis TaxID=401638 RepID=UPI0003F673BD|nr:histidine kinase [Paenibacillus taiwanensis]